jgi:hypothetical protein
MNDFALVTEGITDHAILKNVLRGFYKEQRTPEITQEWPDPQAAKHVGGWTLVLQYLREGRYRQAFQTNSYVVVQVDTDVAADKNFDVPKQNEHGPLSPEQMVAAVIERLKQEIDPVDLKFYGDRFIFAVGVEQLECWLLPLWFTDNRAEQIANCSKRMFECQPLYDELKKKKWDKLRVGGDHKSAPSYDLASREYRNKAALMEKGMRNPSLAVFLQDLVRRNINLPPLEE